MSAMGAPADPVAAAAKLITPEELNAFYNKAQKGVNSVGTWIGDNKELVKIGGEALNGAFGPQAQYVNLQRERWDSEKSLLARARERLNNPIRLNFGGA